MAVPYALAAVSASIGFVVGSEKAQLLGGLAKAKAFLGLKSAAVDLQRPEAILSEALRLTRETPQHCGVLSTTQLQGGVASRMVQLREPFGVQEEDGEVTVNFFTTATSRKVQELEKDPRCALLYWNPDTLTYVTFSGEAQQKPQSVAKAFWRPWMQILYKDPKLYRAWHLHVQRIQVVSIGRLESYRKDWRPIEIEKVADGWKVLCDGTE